VVQFPKRYGFIQPQGGGKDVFVHISAVEKAGLSSLSEGQVVEYEEVANQGKNIGRKFEGSTPRDHADIDAVLNMPPTDEKTEVVLPAEVPEDLLLPSDTKVIFLGGLFVLAVLAATYVASDIRMPLVFAIVLKLLLSATR
jgi:cold shock CspA family protein